MYACLYDKYTNHNDFFDLVVGIKMEIETTSQIVSSITLPASWNMVEIRKIYNKKEGLNQGDISYLA